MYIAGKVSFRSVRDIATYIPVFIASFKKAKELLVPFNPDDIWSYYYEEIRFLNL